MPLAAANSWCCHSWYYAGPATQLLILIHPQSLIDARYADTLAIAAWCADADVTCWLMPLILPALADTLRWYACQHTLKAVIFMMLVAMPLLPVVFHTPLPDTLSPHWPVIFDWFSGHYYQATTLPAFHAATHDIFIFHYATPLRYGVTPASRHAIAATAAMLLPSTLLSIAAIDIDTYMAITQRHYAAIKRISYWLLFSQLFAIFDTPRCQHFRYTPQMLFRHTCFRHCRLLIRWIRHTMMSYYTLRWYSPASVAATSLYTYHASYYYFFRHWYYAFFHYWCHWLRHFSITPLMFYW